MMHSCCTDYVLMMHSLRTEDALMMHECHIKYPSTLCFLKIWHMLAFSALLSLSLPKLALYALLSIIYMDGFNAPQCKSPFMHEYLLLGSFLWSLSLYLSLCVSLSLYMSMILQSRCQNHIPSENIWLVWSGTSYSGERWRHY